MIGIGAGPATDGQVLVFHDLLGIYDGHAPRFAKRYGDLRAQMVAGVAEYAAEVRTARSPGPSTPTRSTSRNWLSSRLPWPVASGGRRPRRSAAGSSQGGRTAAGRGHYHDGMPRLAQVFAPRDRVYFDLFEEAGQNICRPPICSTG